MKYHIKNQQGDIIASFRNEVDRELFLSALEDEHPDCEFDEFNEKT